MVRFNGITIDRQHRWIRHNGRMIFFRPSGKVTVIFRLACALLLARPKTQLELFDLLYRDDPEGGPLDPNIVGVMIAQHIKPRFARIGLQVRTYGGGYPKRYWAEPAQVVRLEAAE